MRWPVTMLALLLASGAASGAESDVPGMPDLDYCAQRDADPRKCNINDGPPPRRVTDPELRVVPQTTPTPDPEYCARRDADPRKCFVQDGPPPEPILRNLPSQVPPPSGEAAPPAETPAARAMRPLGAATPPLALPVNASSGTAQPAPLRLPAR